MKPVVVGPQVQLMQEGTPQRCSENRDMKRAQVRDGWMVRDERKSPQALWWRDKRRNRTRAQGSRRRQEEGEEVLSPSLFDDLVPDLQLPGGQVERGVVDVTTTKAYSDPLALASANFQRLSVFNNSTFIRSDSIYKFSCV